MTNVCPQCSTENAAAAKFCRKCGTSLGAAAPALTPAAAMPAGEETMPPRAARAPAFNFEFDVPQTVRCISCGQDNDPSARFCKKCGTMMPRTKASAGAATAAAAAAAAAPSVAMPATGAQPAPPPRFPEPGRAPGKSGDAIAIAVSLVALVAVVGGGAWWWTHRKPIDSAEPAMTRPATTPVAPPVAAPVAPPVAEPAAPPAPAVEPPPPPAPMPPPMASPPPPPSPPPVAAPAPVPPPPVKQAAPRPPPATSTRPVPRPVAPPPEPTFTQPTPRASPQTLPEPAAPVVVPAGPSTPREACGKRVFLALANCMAEKCDSAEFRSHPQCVQLREENRRRDEAIRNPAG